MKKLLLIPLSLFLSTALATDNWMDQIEHSLNPHNNEITTTIQIIKKGTIWVWDTHKQTLSICFDLPDRSILCTPVPDIYKITPPNLTKEVM